MATNKKAEGKAKAKRKTKPVSRATRKRTVSKAKKIRKKISKKAPLRRASPKKARLTAKPAGKPTPVSERAPEGVSPPSSEQRIGVVTHYYSHLSVVAMQLEPGTTLRVGDVIHIRGHTTDFTQKVESLEVNHASVTEVGPTDDFGLKVVNHAREHDTVFRVRS